MRSLSFFLATLLSLGCICGCGGGGPVQLENVCDEMKDALCDYIKKCDLDFYLKFAARSTCDQLFSCDDMNIDEMIKAVDAGRMAYDADLAGTCLKKIRKAECALFDDMFEEIGKDCEKVFTGLVAAEGDCYQGNECAEGLYCDESVSECPGNCQAYKDIGQTCSGGDCDPDVADCDNQAGVCAALAGAGQVCDYVECQDGWVCDDSSPSVCIQRAGPGGSCSFNGGCETGLQCLDETCKGQAEVDQECDIGSEGEGIMFACVAKHYCDADIAHGERIGTCQPKKGSGSECILFYECTSGLLCIGMSYDEQTQEIIPGACGTPLKAGAACNPGSEIIIECDWDLYCELQADQTGKCTAIPGIGDPCIQGEDPDCFGNDLYCDSALGTCQQKKPAGSDCTSSDECQDGYCDTIETGKCLGYEECTAP